MIHHYLDCTFHKGLLIHYFSNNSSIDFFFIIDSPEFVTEIVVYFLRFRHSLFTLVLTLHSWLVSSDESLLSCYDSLVLLWVFLSVSLFQLSVSLTLTLTKTVSDTSDSDTVSVTDCVCDCVTVSDCECDCDCDLWVWLWVWVTDTD